MLARRAASLFFLLVVVAGCDHSGIHSLGVRRDVTSNCARSTWVRSTDQGTELFLFGVDDPTAPLPIDPTTQEPVPTCFVHAIVGYETSTTIEQGNYVVDATGAGTFDVDAVYTYVYEPTLTTFSRQGSKRDDTPDPATHTLAIAPSGAQVLVTYDGVAGRLTNFREVLTRFDPTTQAGAEVIFGAFNLPLYTSFTRLVGFQALGMTEYLNVTATFQALVSSYFTVLVNGPVNAPQNVFDFVDYEDLNGFVIDGTQVTDIEAAVASDGTMSGVLAFEMRGIDDETGAETLLRGGVDYGNLIVDNGVAGNGFYTVSIEGHGDYTVSWELGDVIDLRSVLPISEGVP